VAKSRRFDDLGNDEDVGAVYEWIDSGRRGNPAPGCDCEACFGMCLGDRDATIHSQLENRYQMAKLRREQQQAGMLHGGAPLDMGDME
jgi:hypothetical protein